MSTNIYSQTFDLQFTDITNDGVNGGNYDVEVDIRGSQDFKLATSNITFNFNSSGLINPSLLVKSQFDYDRNSLYDYMYISNPLPGVVSINITFLIQDASAAEWVIHLLWTDIAIIRFTIADNSQMSDMTFRNASPNPVNVIKCTGTGETFQTMQLSAGTWYSLDVPLPVELSSFTATVKQNIVNLRWQTETEVNNYGFEVERRADDDEFTSWEKVGFVAGSGNSNSPKNYAFVDKNLLEGPKFVYRLKQIDTDGKYKYSDEIEVKIVPSEFSLYQNYPNPFNPSTKIRYQLPKKCKVIIKIYDMLGAEVITLLNEEKKPGIFEVDFNTKSAEYVLPSGTYIYRIMTEYFIESKKMILLK